MASGSSLVGKAWAVLGDFNQILRPTKHCIGSNLNMDRAMRDFDDALTLSSLMDMNYRGCTFTWWNKRRLSPVAKKLDRILVNDEWQAMFTNCVGFFDAPHFSDHSPSCIILNSSHPRQKKPFMFYNYLLKNQDFLPLISKSWFSYNVAGSEMFRVSTKLKYLKNIIREFSKSNSGLELCVQDVVVDLTKAQARMLSSPSSLNATFELEATRKWEILSAAEESFLFQRSRITWIREGDLNSSYFHRMMSTRQSANHIHFLIDKNENRIESQLGIHEHCVSYFRELLGSDQSQSLFSQDDIRLLLGFSCSQEQRDSLVASFSQVEIKDAFFLRT